MFHTILSNFDFLTPPTHHHNHWKWENTRFGLTYVQTEIFFYKMFKTFLNAF